jgi:hypothetical protein
MCLSWNQVLCSLLAWEQALDSALVGEESIVGINIGAFALKGILKESELICCTYAAVEAGNALPHCMLSFASVMHSYV